MTLCVPVDRLARALGAEPVRHPDANITLSLDCPAWLGSDNSHPLRLVTTAAACDDPPACWLIDSRQSAPADGDIPVLATDSDTADLRYRIHHFLDKYLPRLVNGTLVAAEGIGILLRGDAGVGKSQAAIGLLDRGHRLIADDAVSLRSGPHGTIEGHTPEATDGFLFLRGLGPLRIEDHYPRGRLANHRVDGIVTLNGGDEASPLAGAWQRRGLMGRELPGLGLSRHRPIPLLVELAAREIARNRRHASTIQQMNAQQREHRL